MVLTKKAQEAIDTVKIRIALAYHLGKTEQWIIKLIEQNKNDSLLTTATAIKVIKKETGLRDSEILEESSVSLAS